MNIDPGKNVVDVEITPLSEDEFADLQDCLKDKRENREAGMVFTLEESAGDHLAQAVPRLQWVCHTNPACYWCVKNETDVNGTLKSNQGWYPGYDEACNIRFVEVPMDKPLPEWLLTIDGEVKERRIGYQPPNSLADAFNKCAATAQPMPAQGISMGTLKAGKEIKSLIDLWAAALEGGATVTFTSDRQRGDFTLKAGTAGIKFPGKTTATFKMKTADTLRVDFAHPQPELSLGITRNVAGITVAPTFLEFDLPWMLNPRINITN